MTGCDTVSAYADHEKESVWATRECFPFAITNALVALALCPKVIGMEVMNAIQRFIVLMYDRTGYCLEINKARKKIFAKCNNVKRIPPTSDELEQHVTRATYQRGVIWNNTLEKQLELRSPCELGLRKDETVSFEPHWTNILDASIAYRELISCKSNKKCKKVENARVYPTLVCEGDYERQ